MCNLNINFGGFYYSTHSELVDFMLDSYFGDELIPDNINYTVIHKAYANMYIEYLQEYLSDEFKMDIKFHNIKLLSPKFYNYGTDTIACSISNYNEQKLIKLFKKDVAFTTFLTEAVKGQDGYISFYTFDDVYADNKDNILINYIFYFITKALFSDKFFLEYFDLNDGYELLYNLKGWGHE